jgi:hypothetical protein
MEELYGLQVQAEEFVPFTGTGEANFLGERAWWAAGCKATCSL